jgi:hypothetical protein
MIQPPPKPKAPEKSDDEDNEEKYETEKLYMKRIARFGRRR